jgi:hypothetical protein
MPTSRTPSGKPCGWQVRLHDEASIEEEASIELRKGSPRHDLSGVELQPRPVRPAVAARAAVRLQGAVVLVTAINLVAGLGSISSA